MYTRVCVCVCVYAVRCRCRGGEIKFARIDRASCKPPLPRSVDYGAQVVRIPSRRRGGAPLTLESRVASGRCACPRPTADRGKPLSSFLSPRESCETPTRRSVLYKRPFISHSTSDHELWWHDLLFRKFKRFVRDFSCCFSSSFNSLARMFDHLSRFSDTTRFACAIFIGDISDLPELIPSSVNHW